MGIPADIELSSSAVEERTPSILEEGAMIHHTVQHHNGDGVHRVRCQHRLTASHWTYLKDAVQSIATVIGALVAICWIMYIWECDKEELCYNQAAFAMLYALSSTAYYYASRYIIDRTLDNAARTRMCHRLAEEGIIMAYEKKPLPVLATALMVVGLLASVARGALHINASFKDYQQCFVTVVSQTVAAYLVLMRVTAYDQPHVTVLEALLGKEYEAIDLVASTAENRGVGGMDASAEARIQQHSAFIASCRVVPERFVQAAIVGAVMNRLSGRLSLSMCQVRPKCDIKEIAEKSIWCMERGIDVHGLPGFNRLNWFKRFLARAPSTLFVNVLDPTSDVDDIKFCKYWRATSVIVFVSVASAFAVTQLFNIVVPVFGNTLGVVSNTVGNTNISR